MVYYLVKQEATMKDFEKWQQEQQCEAFMRTKEDKVALALSYGAFILFWFTVLALAMGS